MEEAEDVKTRPNTPDKDINDGSFMMIDGRDMGALAFNLVGLELC